MNGLIVHQIICHYYGLSTVFIVRACSVPNHFGACKAHLNFKQKKPFFHTVEESGPS